MSEVELQGSEATSRNAKEVAIASRATGLNSVRPKRWYSEVTMKAPATKPVMYGYITIIRLHHTWTSFGKENPLISGVRTSLSRCR